MKTAADVRSEFLGFFEKNGHTRVASSPLVPQNDPTLMFTNSGMVQFKNVFTGAEKRPYTRATTSQKCVRAGGKHNDLDNVGYTARHLTFFEMLGNFSFGDYFKEQAIQHAWELVTKNLEIDKSKLLVTVYHNDDEAATLWKKIAGFPDEKIIRIKTNDNFWMMGDTGPCGPSSEMFYDKGEHIPGGPPGSPDEDGDRFMEFYNLVFMQFEQEPADPSNPQGGYIRKPLPKPSIDTGMGLERTVTLLQDKLSLFDIDLMRAIIEHCADLTGVSPDGPQSASHKVIADHLRSAAFLIADGVMPSNEGRGYVLRRIMRRGMRHAHLLGAKDPLLVRLFPTLQMMMGEAYPELYQAQALISETLRLEETKFKQTLDRGLRLLADETVNMGEGGTLAGEVAFKLYDTYGFPLDLTQDALREKNMAVDVEGFNASMDKQKAEARKSWTGSGDTGTEKFWFDVLDKSGPTEFLGYAKILAEGQVLAIIKNGQSVAEAQPGDDVQVILHQTPFYAESGGQIGDTGQLISGGAVLNVTDTQKKLGKLFAHIGKVQKGALKVGDAVEARVDDKRRDNIQAHHSATHLLHEALRLTLGDHVAQKGSLQSDSRTRFDISHSLSITPEQIRTVEDMVNAEIRTNTPVQTRVMALDDARNSGARALFGEKYDDEVRVVSMGSQAAGANKAFSVELCGGTHVKNTGDIGLLKVLSESAVGSGVRRIEAVAGKAALQYLNDQEKQLFQTAALLKTQPSDVATRVQSLLDERKKLEQEVTNLRRKLATGGGSGSDESKDIGGIKFIGKVLNDVPAKDLKPLADDMKAKIGSGIIALIATEDGKASIVVAVTPDLTGKYNAIDLVKIGAAALGGSGGGGRPDMAQAGGTNASAANDAIYAIEKKLA